MSGMRNNHSIFYFFFLKKSIVFIRNGRNRHFLLSQENGYSKTISFYFLQFSIKTIYFSNGLVIFKWQLFRTVNQERDFKFTLIIVTLCDFRHIWHPKVKQSLIFKNTSRDHLKRILKSWWRSGWCSSTSRRLLLWLTFNHLKTLTLPLMCSPIIWGFAVLSLLSNAYGKLNVTFWYATPHAITVYRLSEDSNNRFCGINQMSRPFELTLAAEQRLFFVYHSLMF
jgi:hypothetical protein